MMDKRQEVIKIAHTWLGTPYHHRAKVKGAGVDCLTLLVAVYEEAGLIDPVNIPYYPLDWNLHQAKETYLDGLLKYSHEVKDPLPGDVIIWKFGKCFAHAAIVIEWPKVIHAYTGRNCVTEDAEGAAFLRLDKNGRREHKFLSFWDN